MTGDPVRTRCLCPPELKTACPGMLRKQRGESHAETPQRRPGPGIQRALPDAARAGCSSALGDVAACLNGRPYVMGSASQSGLPVPGRGRLRANRWKAQAPPRKMASTRPQLMSVADRLAPGSEVSEASDRRDEGAPGRSRIMASIPGVAGIQTSHRSGASPAPTPPWWTT